MTLRLLPLAAAAVITAGSLVAESVFQCAAAEPTLSRMSPGAVAPGKTTEVVLYGTKLEGKVRVWTSFAAEVEVEEGKSKEGKEIRAKIRLGNGVPVGIGGMVVGTTGGVSDVLYVMVDDLPSASASGVNRSAATAQEVALPVAIDGQCEGTLFDYYRFSAKAGERISCEVVATRLGWDFDPLVRVLDSRGNEILIADDDPATGADPRFVFRAPADGQYVLELRDNRYKPGGRYRLRLGDFPLVTTPLPLAVQRGTATRIGFCGPSVEGLDDLTIFAPAVAPAEIGLGMKGAASRSSSWATLLATDVPVFSEFSAGASGQPVSIKLPAVVSGILAKPGERDRFPLEGKKGTRVSFRAKTRSVGSAAVLALRLLDGAGKQIGESQVTDSDEPSLNVTLPGDGKYELAVEELAGRGGSDYGYAVECRTGPQFSLVLKNDKNNRLRHAVAANGGAFYLDVQCQRAGYDGPITLAIDSPRQGWQVFNNVIAARANEVRMYVALPLDYAAGELTELRVVGRGESEGRVIYAPMATIVQLRAARPQMAYPPGWHEGAVFVGGAAAQANFFRVTAVQPELNLSRQSGQAEVTLDFERLDAKFKEAPVILPLGLPAGVTAEIKREGVTGAKEKHRVVLKGSKDLAEGQHAVRFFTYAELVGQGRGVVSGDVRLNVVSGEKKAELAEAAKP
jgi:hypothetical protein